MRRAQTTVVRGWPEIDRLLDGIDIGVQIKDPKYFHPIPFRVAMPWSAPRNERWHFMLELGRFDIERVFDGQPFMPPDKDVLTFVFPERWMGVHEAHAFVQKITEHPSVKKGHITRCDLITHSPLIVGNFRKEQIRIAKYDTNEPW